jgi:hypothetical protein
VLKVPEGRYCEGCWQSRKGWLPDRPKPPQRPKLPTRRQRNAQRDKRAGAAAATAAHRSSSDDTDGGSQKGDSAAVAAACDSGFGSQEVDTMDEGVGNAASQELLQPPVARNAMGSGSPPPPPAKNAKGSGDPAAQVGEEPPLKAMEIVDRKLEEGVGAQMMAAGFATANFVLQEPLFPCLGRDWFFSELRIRCLFDPWIRDPE